MGTLHAANRSIWLEESTPPDHPPLAGDDDAEVVVIGAGVTGLSAALQLRQTGRDVVVIEAGRVASGVTAYSTAKVTSQHGAIYRSLLSSFGEEGARTYASAQQAGLEQTAAWVRDLSIDCGFGRAPAHVYTTEPDRVDELREEAGVARDLGLPATFTTDTDLPFRVAGAVRFDDQAMFDPRAYVLGLARALVDAGGRIHEGTRALDVDHGEPCTVRTDRGDLRGGHVVVATLLPFLDRGAFFAKTHPERSYCIAVRVEGATTTSMHISADQPTRSVRPHRPGDAAVLIVAGESHKTGQDDDTRQRYAALEEWARRHYDVTDVVARWSAQDYLSADGMPYIGRVAPGQERILIATGYSKWGFTRAAVAGLVLRDAVTGAPNPWADLFDATRVEPTAAAGDLVRENLDVVKRFVVDRVRTAVPPLLEELRPGDGGVVVVEGRKVAAFRDDEGTVRAVSPTCTHMGCQVAFNTAERTWDCPCHGSRFDLDGHVIQGPAVRDLEPDDG